MIVTEPDPLDVAAAVYMAIGLYVRRMRQHPVHDTLTVSEMTTLSRLDRAGSTTSGELAKVERISPQAMGVTFAALEERGLVERRSDPDDGRRVVMSLTDAGHQIVRDRRTARTEQLAAILAEKFSPSELVVLLAAAPLIERLGTSI
jgi:DNA-binding MarR family transcriptional regulator